MILTQEGERKSIRIIRKKGEEFAEGEEVVNQRRKQRLFKETIKVPIQVVMANTR